MKEERKEKIDREQMWVYVLVAAVSGPKNRLKVPKPRSVSLRLRESSAGINEESVSSAIASIELVYIELVYI